MHDAKNVGLSKVEVGQWILVTPERDMKARVPGQIVDIRAREFGRPKDPTAEVRQVSTKTFTPDEWSGKVWTLTLDDGTKTEPRYGTTHVYVTAAPAKASTKQIVTEADMGQAGDRRLVTDLETGITKVLGWKGGDFHGTTKHGVDVHITEDGTVLVVQEDGSERPPNVTPDVDDELPVSAPPVTDEEKAGADRCGGCKGFTVVRKRGSKAGRPYRTLAGAEAATTNGNSEKCPTCKGAGLLVLRAG